MPAYTSSIERPFNIQNYFGQLSQRVAQAKGESIDALKKGHFQADDHYIANIKHKVYEELNKYLEKRQDETGNFKNKYYVKHAVQRTTSRVSSYFPMFQWWSANNQREQAPQLNDHQLNALVQSAKNKFMNGTTERQKWQRFTSLAREADEIASYNGALAFYMRWLPQNEIYENLDEALQMLATAVSGELNNWEQAIKNYCEREADKLLKTRNDTIKRKIEDKCQQLIGSELTTDENIIEYLKLVRDPQNWETVTIYGESGEFKYTKRQFVNEKDKSEYKQRMENLINEKFGVDVSKLVQYMQLNREEVMTATEVRFQHSIELTLQGKLELIRQLSKEDYQALAGLVYQEINRPITIASEHQNQAVAAPISDDRLTNINLSNFN